MFPSTCREFITISFLISQFSLVQSLSCVQHFATHGLYHTRFSSPSPTPGTCPNPSPLSRWCQPTISSSVVPFSSCLQSFPASGPFPMSQFFTAGRQSIGVSASASVLPMNIQNWSPLRWTGWISLDISLHMYIMRCIYVYNEHIYVYTHICIHINHLSIICFIKQSRTECKNMQS